MSERERLFALLERYGVSPYRTAQIVDALLLSDYRRIPAKGTDAWREMVERATAVAYANEMVRVHRTPNWEREGPIVRDQWRETIGAILLAALTPGGPDAE